MQDSWFTSIDFTNFNLGEPIGGGPPSTLPILYSVELVQNILLLARSAYRGIIFNAIETPPTLFPSKLRILATLNIIEMIATSFTTVGIGKIVGLENHVKAHVVLNIAQLTNSQLKGIIVDGGIRSFYVLQRELEELLKSLPADRAAEVEPVTRRLSALANEMTAPSPDREILQSFAASLQRAVSELADLLPAAVPIAGAIKNLVGETQTG
jgi:hypothetical protein